MPETKTTKQRIPIAKEMFAIPSSAGEKFHFIGCRCRQCGERFLEVRAACLKCTARDMEEIQLRPEGVIHNYTVSHMAPEGAVVKPPYVIADVKLTDGVGITGVVDCDPASVRFGMKVEAVLEKIREDQEGNEIISFRFKPVS